MNRLQIMSQLAEDPKLTQAELARRCGLSVAMVNNYMKDLSSAGLLEYHRRSSKSISYHLTAAGEKQINALENELILEMVSSFIQTKERIRERILGQAHGILRRVLLFGRGDLAELVFHAMESAGIRVVGICDDQPDMVGKEWCGRKVLDASQIRYILPDAVIVADWPRSEKICQSLAYLVPLGVRLIRLDFEAISGCGLEPPSERVTDEDVPCASEVSSCPQAF